MQPSLVVRSRAPVAQTYAVPVHHGRKYRQETVTRSCHLCGTRRHGSTFVFVLAPVSPHKIKTGSKRIGRCCSCRTKRAWPSGDSTAHGVPSRRPWVHIRGCGGGYLSRLRAPWRDRFASSRLKYYRRFFVSTCLLSVTMKWGWKHRKLHFEVGEIFAKIEISNYFWKFLIFLSNDFSHLITYKKL